MTELEKSVCQFCDKVLLKGYSDIIKNTFNERDELKEENEKLQARIQAFKSGRDFLNARIAELEKVTDD